MRDHSHHVQMDRDSAVEAMLAALAACDFNAANRVRLERVALGEAFGRVLAEDVCAKTDLPNTLTCCLDSVALRWEDFAGLPEGALPDTANWQRGVQWQFANTGVAMPAGFDTAVVIEHVNVSDDEQSITLTAAPTQQFAGTRLAGSTMRAGDVAVSAGAEISPDVAAAIASAGWSSVAVLARPRVAFIPTGNELVPANLPFAASAPESYAGVGHVFESNGVLTQGKVQQWGGVFTAFDIVPDEYKAIKQAILAAVATADIVVLNAGSSKGSDDWSVEVLEEIGTIVCHQVAHGPGHHSFYALVDGVPVVGISGPPGGASFTLGFYLRPVMRQWLGLPALPQRFAAVLDGSFGENKHAALAREKPTGEQRPVEAMEPDAKFEQVRFMDVAVGSDGVVRATPRAGKAGSAKTQSANGVYMLESTAHSVYPEPGDTIEVELRSF